MAEKEQSLSGTLATLPLPTQTEITLPSTGSKDLMQDGGMSLDCSRDALVQPFPRSPKLLRKLAQIGQLSQEHLSRRVNKLQEERSKAEAHIQSLKKRKADLSRKTEVMKQQVRDCFECMRSVLKKDEQAVLESLELDLRKNSASLDQVLRNWGQHLVQVTKSMDDTQRALSKGRDAEGEVKIKPDNPSHKKPGASEAQIRLNEERFEKLLKILRSISKNLKAQLQRKSLLLDSSTVVIDRQSCHGHIAVTAGGCNMCFSGSAYSSPEHPLQFDKVCCALGSVAVTGGQRYWEVDVHCCDSWAVGMAYGCLMRKGRDKGAKLGRNRNSWCVELRDGHLSAWHNDRNVACQGARQTRLGKVGVRVNYEKGQLTFYDAETMVVLQKFSAALAPVFDRAHHQFTEPLYPAVRFLRPPDSQVWPNHMGICDLNTLC